MQRRTLRICGYQMSVTRSIAENERRIMGAIAGASAQGTDFLLTPEGSLSGYWAGFDGEEVRRATERVARAAREAGVGLALGTCYKDVTGRGEACYNQVRIYTPEGDYLGAYAKILRCSPLDLPGTGEMVDFVQGTLRTFEYRGIRFGALICNDLWATPGYTTMPNPYLAWQLKCMGAEFILHAVNSGADLRARAFHESSVALWSRTLKMHIVEVNASEGDRPVNARSGLMGADGEWLVLATDVGEALFTCEVMLE